MSTASLNISTILPSSASTPPCAGRRIAFWKASALMMLGLCSVAGAQSNRSLITDYEKWNVFFHRSGTYVAETTNDAGVRFGYVCETNTSRCYFGISSGNHCYRGKEYPALFSSGGGAATTNANCLVTEGDKGNIILLQDHDSIATMVVKNRQIGFALPLDDGMFRVLRFDLRGAAQALAHAKRLAAEHRRQSTQDEIL